MIGDRQNDLVNLKSCNSPKKALHDDQTPTKKRVIETPSLQNT